MIDIPENDIRQRMDPIGLVRFVNVLKGKKVTNSTDVESGKKLLYFTRIIPNGLLLQIVIEVLCQARY